MLSGYLLGDLIDQIDKVHFASADDIHTMAHLYESMLREMRDAAGDSGEFYTPRPVIRLMVEQVDPRLGETVLDPPSAQADSWSRPTSTSAPKRAPRPRSRRRNARSAASRRSPCPTCSAR